MNLFNGTLESLIDRLANLATTSIEEFRALHQEEAERLLRMYSPFPGFKRLFHDEATALLVQFAQFCGLDPATEVNILHEWGMPSMTGRVILMGPAFRLTVCSDPMGCGARLELCWAGESPKHFWGHIPMRASDLYDPGEVLKKMRVEGIAVRRQKSYLDRLVEEVEATALAA